MLLIPTYSLGIRSDIGYEAVFDFVTHTCCDLENNLVESGGA